MNQLYKTENIADIFVVFHPSFFSFAKNITTILLSKTVCHIVLVT